ncbi:MAG: response regulator, partial [Anaerolineae bacterium]|nr:response regulator [Anaerolineae bacterium]
PETRLLIIEDDFDLAEMLETYFVSKNFEVFHAETGESGIEMARSKYPQVILLDVMMPDIDGYEACRRLRQTSLTRYIPIIFLTQRDERANKVKGLELGADDYVTKPFDVDELRLRILSAIRRATQESLHEHRTGLPTAALVEEELERRTKAEIKYTDLRFVIKGFKSYCDLYGFLAGNEVFAFTARVIREAVSTLGTADDFIGLLGDEFVILTAATSADALRDTILKKYKDGINTFYSFNDVERGNMLLNPGTPQEKAAPLMQLIQVEEDL